MHRQQPPGAVEQPGAMRRRLDATRPAQQKGLAERFLKPAELAQLCRNAGLDVLEITGLRYNPFTRKGVVGSDTDINYLLRAQRSA